MTATEDLFSAWRGLDTSAAAKVLPGDAAELPVAGVFAPSDPYEQYLSTAAETEHDRRLHLSLIPQPYVGSVRTAKIFVLMLNPGLGPMDYYSEVGPRKDEPYAAALLANLRQDGNEEYPFFFLNPAFLWHPGATYWRRRFDWMVRALQQSSGLPYITCLRHVAREVCCLQVVPYHSFDYGLQESIVKRLESTGLIMKAALEIAAQPDTLIVVLRGHSLWPLVSAERVILAAAEHRRGAFLSKGQKPGDAILAKLDKSLKEEGR